MPDHSQMCCDKGKVQGITDHLLTCRVTILRACSFSHFVTNRRPRPPAAGHRYIAACLVARGVQNGNVAHRWSASGLAGVEGRLDQLDDVLWVGHHRHMTGRDFDGRRSHTLCELALGIWRDRFVVRRH